MFILIILPFKEIILNYFKIEHNLIFTVKRVTCNLGGLWVT